MRLTLGLRVSVRVRFRMGVLATNYKDVVDFATF